MGSDNTFKNIIIYSTFKVEYFLNNTTPSWSSFVLSKDLGIILINFHEETYRITDEKKWLLSKLKYGF